jgi:Secretion system C-terminal sorting domain
MKKVLLLWALTGNTLFTSAQCECYTVHGIEIPQDTTGIMRVTFVNTCGNQAYMHGWVITDANDTVARFENCFCGVVLPLGQVVPWDFHTELTALPSLNTLHVSIGYGIGNDVCADVQFADGLGIQQSFVALANVYPNPSRSFVHLDATIGSIVAVSVHTVTGQEVLRINNPAISDINVSRLSIGTYTVRMEMRSGVLIDRQLVIE